VVRSPARSGRSIGKRLAASHEVAEGPIPDIERVGRASETRRELFALIGEVGTPTSKAAQPITTEQGVPFIGPFPCWAIATSGYR
jgi:hypothetical protein